MPTNNDGPSGGAGTLPSGGIHAGNVVQHYQLRLPILRTNTVRVRVELTTQSSGTGNTRINQIMLSGEDQR